MLAMYCRGLGLYTLSWQSCAVYVLHMKVTAWHYAALSIGTIQRLPAQDPMQHTYL